MRRTIPACPERTPEVSTYHHPNAIPRTYTIEVITPLFGGGVETGVNDPVTLIRPSSIRGHLRFWWRATRGARFETVEALRQREGEIWGTAKSASPVTINVEPVNRREERKPNNHYGFSEYGPEAYVLFAAKQNGNVVCKEGFSFSLELRWLNHARLQELRRKENGERLKAQQSPLPDIKDIRPDIEAAVWAWVNFGGIGARTRRGCGALYCKDFAPSSAEELGSWFAEWVKGLERPVTLSDLSVPIIESAPLVSPNAQTSLQAWADAVDLMRQFRQEGVGRKPRPNPAQRLSKSNLPGRSYWPEPESIRNYADQRATRHSRFLHIPEDAFPRAEFGLPIVFHFSNGCDPDECELYPLDKTRMASPIILRPLAVGDGGKAVAMVLRLKAPAPDGLKLKNVGKPPSLCRSNISRPDLAKYKNSPMGESDPGKDKRSKDGSALDAFIAFAGEKGFKEVKKP